MRLVSIRAARTWLGSSPGGLALTLLLGVLLPVGWATACVLLGGNFHAVIPEQVYRCAQPTPAQLERYVRDHGIQTILNLRGPNPDQDWYDDERCTAERLGIRMKDIGLISCAPPSRGKLGEVIAALDTAEPPLLVHCFSGSDRTGLVSAIVVLLHTDRGVPEAQRQLALRFGHVWVGRAAWMDRFFERYAAWLQEQQQPHTPERFRDWARNHYRPEEMQ